MQFFIDINSLFISITIIIYPFRRHAELDSASPYPEKITGLIRVDTSIDIFFNGKRYKRFYDLKEPSDVPGLRIRRNIYKLHFNLRNHITINVSKRYT